MLKVCATIGELYFALNKSFFTKNVSELLVISRIFALHLIGTFNLNDIDLPHHCGKLIAANYNKYTFFLQQPPPQF